ERSRPSAVVALPTGLHARSGHGATAPRPCVAPRAGPPRTGRSAWSTRGGLMAAMRRYAAFLRAVSPMNAKMPELKKCFEAAGFTDVKTLLSSGNVVFSARTSSEASIERKAEAAMKKHLGQPFL